MNGSPFRAHAASTFLNEGLASPFASLQNQGRRFLLTREQVQETLQLEADEIQHLIDTRQIAMILIEGNERFCSNDIGRLIDQYVQAARRAA